jgi:hypothetical protein
MQLSPSSPVRESEREREIKKETERERERERKRQREKEGGGERVTGALAPFRYLVFYNTLRR